MAINKKLIHFQKLADFQTQLSAGNILDTSIVFIKDAKQIYTHGQLYSCSYTESELQELLNNKADAADLTDILTQANQYTDNKVANLVGQAPEALDTVYELAEAMATNQDAVDVLNEAIGKKVDKVTGKGLSTNDYTTAEKDKLAGIAQGATANIGTITGIKMNGTSRGSAGVVDLGTVITEHQDISGKLDSDVANATYLKKIDAANTYQPIGDYATKSEIPTKVSELQNDANYIQDDVVSNGVYAVTADGRLINYNSADATATGVALVAGEHKFMIAKSDATNNGSNYNLYWNMSYSDLSLTNYGNADGTNRYGYLGGTSTPQLNKDFTTWTAGALSDFNGKANTAAIAAASSDTRDMCTVLNTFNASDSHDDWYVPACGQLALMYLNMTEINAALTKIGGTALAAEYYWSSSEGSSDAAWFVGFLDGYVNGYYRDYENRVRFVRDILTSKPLKERVEELEELNAILVDTNETADDPIIQEYASVQYVDQAISNLEINKLDKTEADNIYAGKFVETSKQDVLVSGTNIKTINGQSILGEGNVKLVSSLTDLDGIITNGDGTKYLSNDGTYKTISTSNSQAGISQIVTTSNVNYPLLYTPSNQTVTTNTANTYFNSGIYANAYTQSLYATNFYTTSDKQFKTNIQKIKDSENCPIIKQFDWKENETRSYGFIAQELEELGYVELVDTDYNGLKKVNYNAALSLVVGKMQKKIEELEQKIMELENKLSKN